MADGGEADAALEPAYDVEGMQGENIDVVSVYQKSQRIVWQQKKKPISLVLMGWQEI